VSIAILVAAVRQLHATTHVATKGAVLAFTKALAVDETPAVPVNPVSTGNVFTRCGRSA
jgi:hypothetical protein